MTHTEGLPLHQRFKKVWDNLSKFPGITNENSRDAIELFIIEERATAHAVGREEEQKRIRKLLGYALKGEAFSANTLY